MTQLAATLIQAHGRVTPARTRVLAALMAAPSALSHADLEDRLSREGALDRVTLYRVLDWLVSRGLAHKIASDDRVWRFNAVDRDNHGHAHFHCTRCGQVFCLDQLHPTFALSLPPGYVFHKAELNLQGLCPGCSGMADAQ
ncbi:MAG: transcriptional repressor [Hydrogenophilaceae bacterium]|nr:transcriptional repressor [Hydrogenophilaceae bacterium]